MLAFHPVIQFTFGAWQSWTDGWHHHHGWCLTWSTDLWATSTSWFQTLWSIKTVFPSCESLSVCFLTVPLLISKLSFLSVASWLTLFQAFEAEHRLWTCRDEDISESSRGMYVRAVSSVGQSRSERTAAAVTTVVCWWENPAVQQLGGDTLPQIYFSFVCAVDLHCCEWQRELVKLVAFSLQETARPLLHPLLRLLVLHLFHFAPVAPHSDARIRVSAKTDWTPQWASEGPQRSRAL